MNPLLKILNALIELKLPSILIVFIFGVFGYFLLKESPPLNSSEGIAGLICIAAMLLIGIYFFFEQIIKEHYEKIISTQQTAMDNLSRTHSVYEQAKRKNMTSTESNNAEYTKINQDSTTDTTT